MRVRSLAPVFLVLAVALASPASAQPGPDYAAAKQHYLAAKKAQNAGDFKTAVVEFTAAFEITKDPTLLKSIAVCQEGAGDKKAAAESYRRFLAQMPTVTAVERKEIEAKIAVLDPPPPVTQPATGPVIEPDVPTTGPTGAIPGGAPPAFPSESPRWQWTAAWVSVGVAAVFLTTAGALGVSAMSREDDINRLADYRDPTSGMPREYTGAVKEEYDDAIDEGETLSDWAVYAFIGAGVAAGAAAVFFYLDLSRPHHAEDGVTVAPIIGPDTAGVTAGWEF
jgi:hypothetical protein